MDLPTKFSDAEIAAYKFLYDRKIVGWAVDFKTKMVITDQNEQFTSLIEFAVLHGFQNNDDLKQ